VILWYNLAIIMLKKSTILLSIFTLFLTVGLGCKGLSDEQRASIEPVVLNYWTVYNDIDMLREFAAEYQALRPYVQINVRQVRYDEFDNVFVNALADDLGPDIISSHVRWLGRYQARLAEMPPSVQVANVYVKGKYAKETVVETVNQGLPSISNIEKEYVGTVADDVVMDDNVYGLPLAIDTLALYYNVDLLDKSGVPEPPATWDELMEATIKSTKFNSSGDVLQSGIAMGTGENIANSFDILSLLLMQNGVTLAQNGTVTFASGVSQRASGHPTLQALRFYTDFARPTKEVYGWNENMEKAFDAFVRGQSVFYLGFAYEFRAIRARAPRMNLEIINFPQIDLPESGDLQPVNIANYWVESVVRKSAHQDEAWDFVRYMTTGENVKRYTEQTGQPSPFRAHIEEQKENEDLAPFVSQVLNAKNWYHGNNYEAATEAFDELIDLHLEPYGDEQSAEERDAALLIRAAQLIQQTY
jgi:multiple sugar transport system substrate-binding protein